MNRSSDLSRTWVDVLTQGHQVTESDLLPDCQTSHNVVCSIPWIVRSTTAVSTLLRSARHRVDWSLFVGWLTSQQQASVSQGRICSDSFTCCHTEIEVANPTFYLTQSQYTDTGPTSPSADPITPDAWQGSHWTANFEVTGMTRPRKNPVASGIRTRDLPLSRRTP